MAERDWAALERGLLGEVFTRLTADADAVHFRHVCHGWRAAAGAGALVPRPWFVLRDDADDGHGRHAFVRPAGRHRGRGAVVRPVAVGGKTAARASGASRGWLAVSEGRRLLLRDPVSGAEVPLPSFDGDPECQLCDVFLSDDPLLAPGPWTAFAFFQRSDNVYAGHLLAFCRAGDAEWARIDDGHGQWAPYKMPRLFAGLEVFRGRAYVLIGFGRIAVCDLDARRLVVSPVSLEHPLDWEWDMQECLVACGDELLLVVAARRIDAPRPSLYCLGRRRRHVQNKFAVVVAKVQLDADGGGMPVALSKVSGIGDYALFVAPQGHAFELPARAFPAVRAGCVYHIATDIYTPSARDATGLVITDLLDGTQRHLKLPLAGRWHPLSWFCPRCTLLDLDTTPACRRK